MISPEEAVDAINGRFGRHPGYRALHAKGVLCTGTFTATPDAARLCRAAHLQGEPVETLVRLSNGGGDPRVADYRPDVRGMGVSFELPDGSRTDIVSQTAQRFPVRTPEAFIEFVKALKPGPTMLLNLSRFFLAHPEALPALRANITGFSPPVSYATCVFYAVHAFKWIDAAGDDRYVRYRWLPEAGAATLSFRQARGQDKDYLQTEIRERLAQGPARWDLHVQIAAAGDPVDDPTAVWPDDRESVVAGTLEVTGLDPDRDTREVLVFDPVRVTDGIELSDDPVLLFRPRAYSVSVDRRLSEP